MLGYVFTSTLKDFLRPGRLVVWVIVALMIGVMGRVWVSLGSSTGAEVRPAAETYGYLASVIVYRFLALVAAIVTTGVLSQEVDQKTIVYQLTRVVPRGQLLLGRTLACVVAVTLVSWIGAVCGGFGVMGAGFFAAKGWWVDLGILALGAAAYSAFFVGVSLVLQRAMVFSLLFAFGWETFVPNMPGGDLSFVSIYTYLNAMSQHPRTVGAMPVLDALSGKFAENPVQAGVAVAILGIFSAGLMVWGMWWFGRNEYVAREDGD